MTCSECGSKERRCPATGTIVPPGKVLLLEGMVDCVCVTRIDASSAGHQCLLDKVMQAALSPHPSTNAAHAMPPIRQKIMGYWNDGEWWWRESSTGKVTAKRVARTLVYWGTKANVSLLLPDDFPILNSATHVNRVQVDQLSGNSGRWIAANPTSPPPATAAPP